MVSGVLVEAVSPPRFDWQDREGTVLHAFRGKLLGIVAVALALAPVSWADNYVRSVRLSWVEGDVQVQRAGEDPQPALLNMPMVEGMSLTTGSDGVVEIEMEDGSTVRVTPDSILLIPELVTSDSGARRSTVEVHSGSVYIDFKKHGDDQLYFRFPGHDVSLTHSVRLRAEVAGGEAQIAVFSGEFELGGPGRSLAVKKNETISLALGDDANFTLTKNIEPAPYDDWSHQLEHTHDQYASSSSNNGGFWSGLFGSGYNGGNLSSYGQTFYLPAYGWVWQPYGLAPGVAPCSSGYWNWYPGWGWTFISNSPWGWGPCRYGSWSFAPVRGWVWCPPRRHHHHERLWADWHAGPQWRNTPAGFVPPHPPSGNPHSNGGPNVVAVGNAPPNPRHFDPDRDGDGRFARRGPGAAVRNSTLIGRKAMDVSSGEHAASNFVKGDGGSSAGVSSPANIATPHSVRELRLQQGGNNDAASREIRVLKQGILQRPQPPAGWKDQTSNTNTLTIISPPAPTRGDDHAEQRLHNQNRNNNSGWTSSPAPVTHNQPRPAPPPAASPSSSNGGNSGRSWHSGSGSSGGSGGGASTPHSAAGSSSHSGGGGGSSSGGHSGSSSGGGGHSGSSNSSSSGSGHRGR